MASLPSRSNFSLSDLLRVSLCVGVVGVCLYSYVDTQNVLTQLRLEIPALVKEIKELNQESTRLQYEIDLFESPEHLMELSRLSEFSHLKYPMLKEVITLKEGSALQVFSEDNQASMVVAQSR